MRRSRQPLVLLVLLACSASAPGQSRRPSDLGAGKLLVSARDLSDPNFAESVVLLIEYNKQGTLGLMINRRTKVPLSKVLTDTSAAKHASDPVYMGGPVDASSVLALFRSSKKPADDATPLSGDIYVVSSKSVLEKAFASSSGDADLRLYVGYCGWAPEQLENEVNMGGWWIFDTDASLVFNPYPDSVWSRLINRTEQQIATARALHSGVTTAPGGVAQPGLFSLSRLVPATLKARPLHSDENYNNVQ